MHAVGHVAANLSFAAVAISLTHTVKTLEPAFNVLLSKAILGVGTPAPVVATLLPIMARRFAAPLGARCFCNCKPLAGGWLQYNPIWAHQHIRPFLSSPNQRLLAFPDGGQAWDRGWSTYQC